MSETPPPPPTPSEKPTSSTPPPPPPKSPQPPQSPTFTPPKKSSVPAPVGASAKQVNTFLATTKVFFHRFLKSDFQTQTITDQENLALDQAQIPTSSTIVRNFLAWRRALLWISGICLAISSLFSLIDIAKFEKGTPGIVEFNAVMFMLAKAGASALAIIAALKWTQIHNTRKLTRLAWLSNFLIPFIVAMIPVVPFVDKYAYGPSGGQQVLGMMLIFYLVTLLPMIIGLFPGLIRSSLTLKTLIPESTMPGWIAVIIAPLYSLFFLIALVISMQSRSTLAIIAFSAFTAAPLVLVYHGKKITSPVNAEHLPETLGFVRKRLQVLNLIAILFLVILLFSKAENIAIDNILSFLANLIASVLLVTVACSDLLLGLFKSAFLRENDLRNSDHIHKLKKDFTDLDDLGLTELLSITKKSPTPQPEKK